MSSAVRTHGLGVDVGAHTLLDGVDLEVEVGEHLLLCGPSGSGKTTLLRALAGLQRPTRGRVELFGSAVSEDARELLPPQARGIGFLFQGGALWPHMSVRRTLDFVLAHSSVPASARAKKRGELLEWVELVGYEDRMPGTLSGGEAQRLSLARALAIEPRLLLLDEPLGPLDAELRHSLLAKLGELQSRLNLTVIHVTHDPAEARGIASREVRLESGRLQANP